MDMWLWSAFGAGTLTLGILDCTTLFHAKRGGEIPIWSATLRISGSSNKAHTACSMGIRCYKERRGLRDANVYMKRGTHTLRMAR